ncbi:MAG: polysaccharide deacetylase family protein [Oligoflexia bacterium]|nr:polysaccharide deacetylase family protein [Oligoflexia bacterium]
MKKIFLSIDVESDWGGRLKATQDNCQGIKIIIPKLLHFFNDEKIKCNFFISTNILTEFKGLIQEMAHDGHEIASHGKNHLLNFDTADFLTVKDEIYQSKIELEEIITSKIYGFRAPQFRNFPGLYDLLEKMGYLYDSSIVSKKIYLPYQLNQSSNPYSIGQLYEFPVSRMMFFNFPMGFLWINILGVKTFISIFKQHYLSKKVDYLTIYLHPFDLLCTKDNSKTNLLVPKVFYNYNNKNLFNNFKELISFFKTYNFNFENFSSHVINKKK